MSPRDLATAVQQLPSSNEKPLTLRIGRTFQGDRHQQAIVSNPVVTLSGRWLADAGFQEGDIVGVEVRRGEVRLISRADPARPVKRREIR